MHMRTLRCDAGCRGEMSVARVPLTFELLSNRLAAQFGMKQPLPPRIVKLRAHLLLILLTLPLLSKPPRFDIYLALAAGREWFEPKCSSHAVRLLD